MPRRVQMRRTKGWRKPAGAVYVGRPSKWGNPFMVETARKFKPAGTDFELRRACVRAFAIWAAERMGNEPDWLAPLRGKDLACWCGPGPCHADILLELANE